MLVTTYLPPLVNTVDCCLTLLHLRGRETQAFLPKRCVGAKKAWTLVTAGGNVTVAATYGPLTAEKLSQLCVEMSVAERLGNQLRLVAANLQASPYGKVNPFILKTR